MTVPPTPERFRRLRLSTSKYLDGGFALVTGCPGESNHQQH